MKILHVYDRPNPSIVAQMKRTAEAWGLEYVGIAKHELTSLPEGVIVYYYGDILLNHNLPTNYAELPYLPAFVTLKDAENQIVTSPHFGIFDTRDQEQAKLLNMFVRMDDKYINKFLSEGCEAKYDDGDEYYKNDAKKKYFHNLTPLHNYLPIYDKTYGTSRFVAHAINYNQLSLNNREFAAKVINDDIKELNDYKDYYQRNIGISVAGGLGDQVCAEPIVRYVKGLYKKDNVVVQTHFPQIFKHLDVKTYHMDEKVPDVGKYLSLETLSLKSVSHTSVQPTDYASLSALACQLPKEKRIIRQSYSDVDLDEVIEKTGLSQDRLKEAILVHPGKHWAAKTFKPEFWNAVIDSLLPLGRPVIVIGKSGGTHEATGVVDVTVPDTGYNLIDNTTYSELVCLIKNCHALVTNDSAPIHIAGASDCWILSVILSKNPDFVFPYRGPKPDIYYKAKNFCTHQMWLDYKSDPSTMDVIRIDQATDERIEQCLPNPGDMAKFLSEMGNTK